VIVKKKTTSCWT